MTVRPCFDRHVPRKPRLLGGAPACRQAGSGTIEIKFPWLTFCSPLRAREAPPRLPRLNGVGGELHIKAGGVPVQMEVGLI